MTFSEELKRWRKRMGYTQAEAAEVLDVKLRTYEGWEFGRHQPIDMVLRMVRATIKGKGKADA